MPLTPFHFGPGLLVKAGVPARVSFGAFCLANVLIDLESGYNLWTRQYPIHTTAHTFVVAGGIGLVASGCVVLGRRFVPGRLTSAIRKRAGNPAALNAETSNRGALLGGVLGGLTHPFFDGLMHRDIRPFLPFTDANPLLGAISTGALHKGCIAAGLLGATILAARVFSRKDSA